MRSFLVRSVGYRLLAVLLVLSSLTLAGNTPPPKISTKTRQEIVHAFNAELVYIRANFPMGKTGLKLKNGTVTPSGPELQRLMALWGPAVKAGDRARISDVVIKPDHIRFEINGGPVKHRSGTSTLRLMVRSEEARLRPPIPPPTPAALSSISTSTSMFRKSPGPN